MSKRWIRSIATAATTVALSCGVALAASAYTVEAGDTLSAIAAEHGTTWPAIYRVNRSVVGGNPDFILPGMRLVIDGQPRPAAPAAQPAQAASIASPATGHITSPFGMRTHPITGVYKLHSGTDFSVGDGNAYAAMAGTAHVSHPSWAGNLVSIDHGDGLVTQYAHLASMSVSSGERVSAGEVVGRIGARGLATGVHLHFEVLRNGSYVDPIAWLRERGAL